MNELEIFFIGVFKTPLDKLFVAIGIIIGSALINKFFIDLLMNKISKFTKKTKNKYDDNIVKALRVPIKLLVFGVGMYLALRIIDIDSMPSELLSTAKYLKILLVLIVGFFAYNLTLENTILHSEIAKVGERGAGVCFPFVSIVIRVAIIIVAVAIIFREFGLTGFLTGLGISGVVVALAAQDTCSNLFGGMMIVLDKPFLIGDWIQSNEIEGVVQEITFRSTRIRTFANALVTVPNSKLTNNNIINWSQRSDRRIYFKFIIETNTLGSKVKGLVEKIEDMIKNHDKVSDDIVIVSFNEFTTCGLSIFVYFYTIEMEYRAYEKVKEEINLNILIILEEEKIKLADINVGTMPTDREEKKSIDSKEEHNLKNKE